MLLLPSAGHSTAADALMSVAILADDITMWNKAERLFNATIADYLR
jgi:hypothetical protein